MRRNLKYLVKAFIILFFSPPACLAEVIKYSTADEFLMDTPVVTPYEKVSLDFHSYLTRTKNGSNVNVPALMANVGVYPDFQAYGVFPATLSAPKHQKTNYGYGDVRLGLKYRFVHETERLPAMALYPKITVPSGDATRGLGNKTWIGKFPLWMQKQFGDWRVTTGGGYIVNPNKNKCNYPFGGVLIQWQITQYFMLGNEFFAEGRISPTEGAKLISNFGGSYFFNDHSFLAFSAGHSIAGARKFVAFLGYGITWAPPKN